MNIFVKQELWHKLYQISHIRKQYIGIVAIELLEKTIEEIDIEKLKQEYGYNKPDTSEGGEKNDF